MSQERHFTTRRGFVGGVGFGALGLYATWAAYGASPLPFSLASTSSNLDPHTGHAPAIPGHAGHADPAMAETHGAARLSPAEFTRRHAAFLKRFQAPDGSTRPLAETAPGPAQTHGGAMPGHSNEMTAMVMTDPAAPAASQDPHDAHAAHDAAPAEHAAPAHQIPADHDHAPPIAAREPAL